LWVKNFVFTERKSWEDLPRGDLDNRLKTLLDALSVPNQDQVIPDPTIDDPIHCLLEDDSLVSGLEIETRRLLTAARQSR
jgi:hypothetical protein